MDNKNDVPYSSLFNYEEEDKQLAERKAKLDAANQRISRTNAIGEAFRILADGIGGARGANIVPRAVNPGILKAADKYYNTERETEAEKRRLKMVELGLKEKDKARGDQLGDIEANKQFSRESQLIGNQAQKERIQEQYAQQKDLEESRGKNAIALEGKRGKNNLNEVYARNKGNLEIAKTRSARQGELAQKGLFEVARYDDSSMDTIVSRNQVISMLDELKQHLTLKGIYPTRWPKVLQTANTKGKISDDDLKVLIGSYPEFFQTRLPELTGGKPAGGTDEPEDKDVFQMMMDTGGYNQNNAPAYNGPYRQAGQPATVQPVSEPSKPVTQGTEPVVDVSSFFNN